MRVLPRHKRDAGYEICPVCSHIFLPRWRTTTGKVFRGAAWQCPLKRFHGRILAREMLMGFPAGVGANLGKKKE